MLLLMAWRNTTHVIRHILEYAGFPFAFSLIIIFIGSMVSAVNTNFREVFRVSKAQHADVVRLNSAGRNANTPASGVASPGGMGNSYSGLLLGASAGFWAPST
jgi:hypothetical protein